MNKELLQKIIDDNKVIELLEKLSLEGFETYDDKYKRLLEILVYLLNNVNYSDTNSVQQYLFKCINKVKDSAFEDEDAIDKIINILKSNSSSPYQNVASFIQRLILNIEDDVEGLKHFSTQEYLKTSLLRLNEYFLAELIMKEKDYISIIHVFYCCVQSMELPKRRVILGQAAIDSFLTYIKKNPMGYLSHFIRPYYSMGPNKDNIEYYLHVGEPFLEQIFDESGFESFLNAQGQSDKLVRDITVFYNELIKSKSLNKVVMIHSNDNIEASDLGRDYLKLESDGHVWVRKGCLPPYYRE